MVVVGGNGSRQIIRWSQVRGPVTGLVALLSYWKWDLEDPHAWFPPSGSAVEIDFTCRETSSRAWAIMEDWFLSQLCQDAAHHYDSAGVGSGVDFGLSTRALHGVGGSSAFQAAAACFQCGAMLTEQRAFSMGMSAADTCRRCGKAAESTLHCLYQCPDNDMISDEDFTVTDELVEEALASSVEFSCLYLRGLIP